jgi:hypothetical protein
VPAVWRKPGIEYVCSRSIVPPPSPLTRTTDTSCTSTPSVAPVSGSPECSVDGTRFVCETVTFVIASGSESSNSVVTSCGTSADVIVRVGGVFVRSRVEKGTSDPSAAVRTE